jgi:hypothetical protein
MDENNLLDNFINENRLEEQRNKVQVSLKKLYALIILLLGLNTTIDIIFNINDRDNVIIISNIVAIALVFIAEVITGG